MTTLGAALMGEKKEEETLTKARSLQAYFPLESSYAGVYMCVCLYAGQRPESEEADGNVFFSKQERLLNPCLLEQGGLRGGSRGGCVVMPGIQVYGWPKEVSIIHKARPPYAP